MRTVAIIACAGFAAWAGAQTLQKVPPRPGHLVYLPKRMWSSGKRWPLVLYLHGKSLRGTNLSAVLKYGLPRRLQRDKGFPFIAICPQLAPGQRWTDTAALAGLVQDAMRRYPVDRSRVYAVGFSMGASGVWRVAHAYPRLFAAVVSVAGQYEMPLAARGRLKGVPIWAIHGSADTDTPMGPSKRVFDVYAAKGGRGRFTILPGKGHGIPEMTERSDVYQWLLRHRRR